MSSLVTLNDDVMMLIFTYLEPHHVIHLHHAFPQIVNEIFQRNPHFKMPCYTYIRDDIVDWFEMNHKPLDLMIETKHCQLHVEYLKNGKKHRDDDLPAIVSYEYGEFQYWYQNGKLYRENGKPALITREYKTKKVKIDFHVDSIFIPHRYLQFEIVNKNGYIDIL